MLGEWSDERTRILLINLFGNTCHGRFNLQLNDDYRLVNINNEVENFK